MKMNENEKIVAIKRIKKDLFNCAIAYKEYALREFAAEIDVLEEHLHYGLYEIFRTRGWGSNDIYIGFLMYTDKPPSQTEKQFADNAIYVRRDQIMNDIIQHDRDKKRDKYAKSQNKLMRMIVVLTVVLAVSAFATCWPILREGYQWILVR